MKVRIISMFTFFLISCSNDTNIKNFEFPYIVIETNQDTLNFGDVYKAKISLSDTSYLYLLDENDGVKRRIYPVFRINGEIKDLAKDYFLYEEVVDSINIISLSDGTKIKEWSCGIIFPHPQQKGDVELGYRMSYVIENY